MADHGEKRHKLDRCGRIARCLVRLPNATNSTPLEVAATMARSYLERIGDERLLTPEVEIAIGRWKDPKPEEGVGALAALTELGERACEAATRSSGPGSFIS
jgi:hypothetical protein